MGIDATGVNSVVQRLRGRPAGRMTPLRKKAAEAILERVSTGDRVIVAAVARRLGVDRRSARRIIRDVERLSVI